MPTSNLQTTEAPPSVQDVDSSQPGGSTAASAISGTRGYLFTDDKQAAAYAAYRPRYPQALYDTIYRFAEPASFDTALDVATGSGQAAVELSKRYRRVIAQDASAAQLAQAEQADNIEYVQAAAEDMQLPDSSIDLVTVAEALHWFDLDAFYQEAARVLKPGGTLAAWGYDIWRVKDSPDANAAMHRFCEERLGPYFDQNYRLIKQEYRGIEPYGYFPIVERAEVPGEKEISIDHVLGWLRSWSSYTTYRKLHPDRPDPLLDFHADLKQAIGFHSHADTLITETSFFLVLAKKAQDENEGQQ